MANHQYADAIVIVGDQYGLWNTTVDPTGPDFEIPEISPADITLSGTHAAWFKYHPPVDTGTVQCFVDSGSTVCVFTAYAHTVIEEEDLDAWGLVATQTGAGAHLNVGLPSDPTITSYFRVAATDAPASFGIYLSGLPTPPVAADTLEAPPITLRVRFAASVPPVSLALTSPEDGSTLASATPDFVVALTSADSPADTYTIEVQYDDNAAFSHPSTLDATTAVYEGGAVLTPAGAVPAHTYWRARATQNGIPVTEWTNPHSFTVDTHITASLLAVTWTVDAGADRPIHVWHLDPPGPAVGDTVTVYGQGFPSSGHLSFGTETLAHTSWTRVAATGTTTGRVIDGDLVDPEHYEIVFVAPAYDGPGGVLSVED